MPDEVILNEYAKKHYNLSTDVELFLEFLLDYEHDAIPELLVSDDGGFSFQSLSNESFCCRNGLYTKDSIRKWFIDTKACFIIPQNRE